MDNNSFAAGSKEKRTGRPRRLDDYEKISFTISTALLDKIDRRARQWGVNRSGAVSRMVKAQIDGVSSENYLQMKRTLEEINDVLEKRRAG